MHLRLQRGDLPLLQCRVPAPQLQLTIQALHSRRLVDHLTLLLAHLAAQAQVERPVLLHQRLHLRSHPRQEIFGVLLWRRPRLLRLCSQGRRRGGGGGPSSRCLGWQLLATVGGTGGHCVPALSLPRVEPSLCSRHLVG